MRMDACGMAALLAAAPSGAATLTVALDGSADYQTIMAAVGAAQSGDVLQVEPGNYEETIVVSEKNLSLVAADAGIPPVIDGAQSRRCLEVGADVTLSVTGFTFANGQHAAEGGGVAMWDASVTMTDCELTGCVARDGGGVWVGLGSSATFNDVRWTSCEAENRGGALHVEESIVTVDGCVMADNVCGVGGGGISVADGVTAALVTVTASALQGNLGTGDGDAIASTSVLAVAIDGTAVCDHAAGGEVSGLLSDGGGNTFGGWCCPGDVDEDGDVDAADLVIFLSSYDNALVTADDRVDLDRDESASVMDLIGILRQWGPCE